MDGNVDRTLYAIKVAAAVIQDAKLQQRQQTPFIKSAYAKPSESSKYAYAKLLAKRVR